MFEKTRKVLQSKQKQLKKQGKGNKPKASVALTSEELKILYEKGLLGMCSPESAHGIQCVDCPWSYTGETGRCLKTRVKEHTRNTKAFKKGSNVATHAWLNDHSIDFKSAHVIDKGNFRVRKTLESWHTAITSDADNNAKQLPRQYSIFIMIF